MARYNSYGIDDQHSSYWMGDIFRRSAKSSAVFTDDSEPTRTDDLEEALRLITLKRSVANFVSIVTGQAIPVVFSSGQQSYTDGKSVVLSAGDDGDFDSLVGTALHEGAHIILSDFEFLRLYLADPGRFNPPSLVRAFEDNFPGRGEQSLTNLIKLLFNIVEDRRIDYYIYREAPGYRPYYEAMYDRYWRSKQIDYAMRDRKMTVPTVENYLFHLTNIANRYFDTRNLPQLDLIYGLIDLDNLNRFDGDPLYKEAIEWIGDRVSGRLPADLMPGLWTMLFQVAEIILTQSDEWEIEIEPPVGPGRPCENESDSESDEEGGDNEGEGAGYSEDENEDEDSEGGGPSQESEEEDEDETGTGLDNLDGGLPGDDSDEDEEESSAGSEDEEAEDEADAESDGAEGEDEDSADSDSESEDDETGESDDGDSDDESAESEPDPGRELSSGTDRHETPDSLDGSGDKDDDPGVTSDGYEFEVQSRERHAAPEIETRGKRGEVNEKKLLKDIEKQNKFAESGVKKKAIKKNVQNAVDAMESAGASIDEISIGDFKAKVLVLPSLTREMLMTGASPFNYGTTWCWESAKGGGRGRYNYRTGNYTKPKPITSKVHVQAPSEKNLTFQPQAQEGVAAGLRMGKTLAHKLSIRNQNSVQKYNRQPRGKIDKRRIANIGAGDDSIFYHLRKTAYEPVYLHLTIDASSSMGGEKWKNSLALGAALGVAANEIENLEVEISIRAGVGAYAVIQTIYDSTLDTPAKIRSLWPYLTCPGLTPEGLCFEVISDQILARARKRDGYFVNISDGMPWFRAGSYGSDTYGGEMATKHTRGEVRKIEKAGVKILSYYVEDIGRYSMPGQHLPTFRAMYGKAAEAIDVTSVLSIARTLNKLFLS